MLTEKGAEIKRSDTKQPSLTFCTSLLITKLLITITKSWIWSDSLRHTENLFCSKGWIVLNSELKTSAVLTGDVFFSRTDSRSCSNSLIFFWRDNPSHLNGIPIDVERMTLTNSKRTIFSRWNYTKLKIACRTSHLSHLKHTLARILCWQSPPVWSSGLNIASSWLELCTRRRQGYTGKMTVWEILINKRSHENWVCLRAKPRAVFTAYMWLCNFQYSRKESQSSNGIIQ